MFQHFLVTIQLAGSSADFKARNLNLTRAQARPDQITLDDPDYYAG
jgi:hypothetical protein